jgi:hypothetical protein
MGFPISPQSKGITPFEEVPPFSPALQMLISSAALISYLDSKDTPLVRVRELSGEWRVLPVPQVLALARAECIYGIGSQTRLKYCVLDVSNERADEVIDDAADRLHSSDASKTTLVSRNATERDGRTFRYTLYQHHNQRCFAWGQYV